jgi:hypothetical protein
VYYLTLNFYLGSLNIELAGNSMTMDEIESGKSRSYTIEEGDSVK